MNPGSQAFAMAIDETPASRSSLTIRSCNVPNARSMCPFACGLLAQMMSMFSANSARPNWVTPSPPAGVLVADLGGEEFQEPARCVIAGSGYRCQYDESVA